MNKKRRKSGHRPAVSGEWTEDVSALSNTDEKIVILAIRKQSQPRGKGKRREGRGIDQRLHARSECQLRGAGQNSQMTMHSRICRVARVLLK
jgi:hypothetical protein